MTSLLLLLTCDKHAITSRLESNVTIMTNILAKKNQVKSNEVSEIIYCSYIFILMAFFKPLLALFSLKLLHITPKAFREEPPKIAIMFSKSVQGSTDPERSRSLGKSLLFSEEKKKKRARTDNPVSQNMKFTMLVIFLFLPVCVLDDPVEC